MAELLRPRAYKEIIINGAASKTLTHADNIYQYCDKEWESPLPDIKGCSELLTVSLQLIQNGWSKVCIYEMLLQRNGQICKI